MPIKGAWFRPRDRSTYDACLTLTNDVRTLQRPRLKVSSLFLDIKAGFDNVDNNTLARILREGGIPSYLVSWVSSFLGERSCTLIFQGAPGTPGPVNVGAPQGSPISPLLFLLYVAPLHFRIPRGLMISYVDDFALTVASLSYRGNIRRLQELFKKLERKASRLGVSFSVAKTELIHWSTPSQRHSPKCVSPIQIKGEMFHPSNSVQWLGYWFTPALDPAAHYSRRLALAQGAFALIRRLSPPGAGSPLPMPQIGDITNCPHPTLRRRPLYTQRGNNNPRRYILAQGPEVDHKLLLSQAHRDSVGGVVPPTNLPPDHPPAKACGAQDCLFRS